MGHVFYVYRPQNCGKIVISDFVLLKKNNKPHIFTTPLPSGRGVVKIWGLLFFGIFSNFLSESVQLQPPVSKYNFPSSMIKVKNRLDRSLKTLEFFVSTISDDT